MFCFIVRERCRYEVRYVLSFLNLKTTFGGEIVVSNTILQNHWRFSHNTPPLIEIFFL